MRKVKSGRKVKSAVVTVRNLLRDETWDYRLVVPKGPAVGMRELDRPKAAKGSLFKIGSGRLLRFIRSKKRSNEISALQLATSEDRG